MFITDISYCFLSQTLRESRRAARDPITCVEACGSRGRSFTLAGTSSNIGERASPSNVAFRVVATADVRKSMSLRAMRGDMISIGSLEIVQHVAKIANTRELQDIVNCSEWSREPPAQDDT